MTSIIICTDVNGKPEIHTFGNNAQPIFVEILGSYQEKDCNIGGFPKGFPIINYITDVLAKEDAKINL